MNPVCSAERKHPESDVADERGHEELMIYSSRKRTGCEIACLLLIWGVVTLVDSSAPMAVHSWTELIFGWATFVPLLVMVCCFMFLYAIFAYDDEYAFDAEALTWKQDGRVKRVIPWKDVKAVSGYFLILVLKDGISIRLNSNFSTMGKLRKALGAFYQQHGKLLNTGV